MNDFEREALEAHNKYRARHGVQPLTLDRQLCNYAKEWAVSLAQRDGFQHRPNNRYGENLYCSWSSDPNATCSGKTPVDNWYAEISKYNFSNGGFSMGTGHFTQVVWKNTTTLGIAQAKSRSGKIIVVANYSPAGNFQGQFGSNVPRPQ